MAAKKQLGQILLEAGAIDEFQLKSALGYQKQWGGRLGKVLVENRFITEEALVAAIHRQTGIEVVQLDKLKVPDYVIKMVPVELAERNNMIPVRLEGEAGKGGECLVLAMSDPTNLNVLDELQFRTGKRSKGLLASESSISKAIRFYYHGDEGEELPDFLGDPHKIQFGGQEIGNEEMAVVQGKLESTPPKPAVEPSAGIEMEDPFAELESLAKGPEAPAPQPPPAPPNQPEPTDMIDVDIDVGDEPETSPATPAALQQSPSPQVEEELPEVEILEEVEEEAPEEPAAFEPEPASDRSEAAPPSVPEPPLAREESAFGTSGDLLGSGSDGLTADELFSDAEPTPEPGVSGVYQPSSELEGAPEPELETEPEPEPEPELEPEPKAQVEKEDQPPEPPEAGEKPEAPVKGSSAMEALLSRVGIGAKPGAPDPKPEPKTTPKAPQPELPDLGEPALLDDLERLLDRLESDQEDAEPPQMMKSSHLIAALIRLLLKKDLLTQEELLDELKKR
jgi:hypothetical protein